MGMGGYRYTEPEGACVVAVLSLFVGFAIMIASSAVIHVARYLYYSGIDTFDCDFLKSVIIWGIVFLIASIIFILSVFCVWYGLKKNKSYWFVGYLITVAIIIAAILTVTIWSIVVGRRRYLEAIEDHQEYDTADIRVAVYGFLTANFFVMLALVLAILYAWLIILRRAITPREKIVQDVRFF